MTLPPTNAHALKRKINRDSLVDLTLNPDITEQQKRALTDVVNHLDRQEQREKTPVYELDVHATEREIQYARQYSAVMVRDRTYLPVCPAGYVPVPNALLRSALWSIRDIGLAVEGLTNPTTGEWLRHDVPSYRESTVVTTGPDLGWYDRKVFAACLSLYADRPVVIGNDGPMVDTTYLQLMKAMGVSYSASNHKSLASSLTRLAQVALEIRAGARNVRMPRLLEFEEGAVAGKEGAVGGGISISFRVSAQILQLFGRNQWSKLSMKALAGRSGIQAWLAAFFATHAAPYPLDLPILHKLTGSNATVAKFRAQLKIALDGLSTADTPPEIRISRYSIDRDKATVYLVRWEKPART